MLGFSVVHSESFQSSLEFLVRVLLNRSRSRYCSLSSTDRVLEAGRFGGVRTLEYRSLIRVYRLWEFRGRAIIVFLIVSMTVWWLYLQFTWVTLPQLELYAFVAACLLIENYIVNVKAYERGFVEMSPIWSRIEKRFGLKYSCPLITSTTLATIWMFGSYLGQPLWFLAGSLSIALPAIIFASVNDLMVLLDDPVLERRGT